MENRAQTRTQVGLGLGLAIVRYLVEAHGGSISAESAGKGKGSTFTILLPLMAPGTSFQAVESEAERASGEASPASIRDERILVVEDDPGTREALFEMLRLIGAAPYTVESAEEATKVFEEFNPSLLVCDIALPGEDGCSFLRRIRALPPDRGGNVPAVALTALASEDDRRRVVAAGFQKHLAKPVDIDRLIVALAELLRQAPTASPQDSPEPLH